MKSVLNIAAAVLIAAGLVVAVASLLTPGQVILGIDFKLAATLIVGGLILYGLASALIQLERMSHDLRQLRRAGSEEPPWLRQSAAAMAAAASAAAVAEDAVAEDEIDVAEEDSALPTAEEPATEAEVVAFEAESRGPAPAEDQAEQAIEVEAAESAAEDQAELPIEFEPSAAVIEEQAAAAHAPSKFGFADQPAFEPEPDPSEASVVGLSEFEREADPSEATVVSAPEYSEDAAHPEPLHEPEPLVEIEPGAAGEPELFEDQITGAASPSMLKPSHDPFGSPHLEPEPSEPPFVPEPAVEEHAALYVVEERMFRGRQARVLSDGTIEAETAEGWMRFEDFDHLEEYLDAMAELGR